MFFEKWLHTGESKQTQCEPKFLTTQGLNFYIEKLINEADKFLCLVTPYFKINSRFQELLLARKQQNIQIFVVCRMDSLKQDIFSLANQVQNRSHLHAKCFLSDKAVIVGSMNLYDFSQINNDEMGFYIEKASLPDLYEEILQEVRRIYSNTESQISDKKKESIQVKFEKSPLEKGKKYTFEYLDSIFDFEYKKPSGIKSSKNEDIVLFMNRNGIYKDNQSDNLIYYQGQNTGKGEQQLLYGNKMLYDRYFSPKGHVYLLENYVFLGECHFAGKPFKKDGKWYFPLTIL